MGKTIINKHIDDSSKIKRKLFHDDLIKAKGEIIINNDPENPSIYIVNNKNEVVKVSGSNNTTGGTAYDDTKIWKQVNENTNKIKQLQENGYDDSELLIKIQDNADAIELVNKKVLEGENLINNTQKEVLKNTNSIEELKESINNFECEEYDDSELRSMISNNAKSIEELKNLDFESVLKEDIIVAGLTGQFGAGNYSNNDVISAGTSFSDILLNLLCKELYPENIKKVSATASTSLKELTLELNYNGEAEVGSLVSLISGETNGMLINKTDSSISNIEYGYSFNNDNTKISNDTSIISPCEVSIKNPLFEISATINSGFDADNIFYVKRVPETVAQNDNVALAYTDLGCLVEGDNKITINAIGATCFYSAKTINGVYCCSNLGKTKDESFTGDIDTSYATINAPLKSKSQTIKGKYKYFLGYSDYQSIDEFRNKPNDIRNLTIKSDFIEKDSITTIIGATKIKSNGKSIVIACPNKYKLATIDDSTGASLLGSFKSQGEIDIQTGMITTTYNVYLLPISNGTELEFKNVTLTNNE